MQNQWKSMLAGAAVAALITIPAAADSWVSGQTRTYDTHSVKVQDLIGNLTVQVRDGGPMAIQLNGGQDRVNGTSVRVVDGDTLVVDGENNGSVWDWRHWLDFSVADTGHSNLQIRMTVPKGTEITVDNLVGDAHIGDTMGPMHFSAVSTDSTIGKTSEAHISLAGSGKVVLADVSGDLHAETAGAGKIIAGKASDVHADVAGSGSMQVASIGDSLHLDIAGSGDFSSNHVDGPVHVSIAGSGSVSIANGRADPLHVDIMGSGNFTFGGTAVDPHISALGSGNVKLKAIEGELHNDGMATVKVGD